MKTFFRSSKRKIGIILSSCDESFRKLLIVCEIKRFGKPAWMKEVFRVFMSLTKSVEIRLALGSAPVMQFPFHLIETSDFQCVGSFPGFLKTLRLNLLL